MTKNPDDDEEESRKSVREFFGITADSLRFSPIPCNTFNSLVQIYSCLPDQTKNPLAKYANRPEFTAVLECPKWNLADLKNPVAPTQGKDGLCDNSVPRRKKETSNVSANPSGVEDRNLSSHYERNSDITSGALCIDDALSEPELTINELEMSKACDAEGTNAETTGAFNAHDDLRILMDESDNLGMIQLPHNDVNLDLTRGLSSILKMDRSGDESMIVERKTEKLTAGEITKKNVVDKKKRERVEVITSISEGGVGNLQAQQSANRGISRNSISQDFVNQNVTCPQDARSKDRELLEQKKSRGLSEFGGLVSSRMETDTAGEVSTDKFVDNFGKGDQLTVVAKGKPIKVKNSKKTSRKNAESGKRKHKCISGEAFNSMESGVDDPAVAGKRLKQNAIAVSVSPSVKKDERIWPESHERLQYTREQLLDLRKTAFVPEYIEKAAQEIQAEIHGKDQISAALEIAGTSILKNKRGGSLSEGRKEKKKLKKKKKRAELNRKLGVKRLKLKPVLKPKVVQHCRHYLNGRCHEGEKCKFSHDVVPLTKSKPCSYFARKTCMKGDDCPFDHQLAKYPCNNFVDTGFCGRGDACMFSHKIPVKEGSSTPAIALKVDCSSVDQLDSSKFKQKLDASKPFASGKSAPNISKETLAMKISQPAKKPKGLSFLSFGRPQPDDSVQLKEPGLPQQRDFTARTNVQPDMASGAASNVTKMLTDIPGSGTQQGIDHPIVERTAIDMCMQPSAPLPGDNSSRYISSRNPVLSDSVRYQLKDTSAKSDYAVGTSTPYRTYNLSETFYGTPPWTPTPDSTLDSPTPNETPDRAPYLTEMFKDTQTPMNTKGIHISSSVGPSFDISGGKSASVSSTKGHTDLQHCFKEKGIITAAEKSKEVQPALWGSQTSSVQFPTNISLPVKKPPSNAQKALQSALAFAAKYESGITMSSVAAPAKENNKNEGT